MDILFRNYVLRDPYQYELELYRNTDVNTIINDIIQTSEYNDILQYKKDYNFYYNNNYLGLSYDLVEIKNKLITLHDSIYKKEIHNKDQLQKEFIHFIEKEYMYHYNKNNYIHNINDKNNNYINNKNNNIIQFIKKGLLYIYNKDNKDEITLLKQDLEVIYNKVLHMFYSLKYNIAVLLHIGNYTIWHNIKKYLENIDIILDYDFYVNICLYSSNENVQIIKNEILKYKPNAIITTYENIGMDIGPFLKQIKLIKESGKSYNYILKLHSKSDNIWRNELMDPLLSNPETIKNYLHSFTNNSDVGMVCSKGWLLNMDNLNNSILSELLKKYNLYINKTCKFVGGTIFWIKWDILKSFFTVNVIDDIYSHLEKGYMSNNTPTYVHSMERLLGILIINYKTKYLDL